MNIRKPTMRRNFALPIFVLLVLLPGLLQPLLSQPASAGFDKLQTDSTTFNPWIPNPPLEELDQEQAGYDYGFWFDDQAVRWQEFMPDFNNLTSVEVYISKQGNPGDVMVQIQTTGGSVLAEQLMPEGCLGISGWVRVYFNSPVYLLPGNIYRIYVYANTDSVSPTNRYVWRGNLASTYCPACNNDVSNSWPNYDYAFRTYGVQPFFVTNLYIPVVVQN
ncbi:MAG: DUF4082 domain-containing protein [Anaerolineales bacterium]|nr:DUF4082 domain-containing protein [Anaerolineales bacterium]